MLPWKDLEPLCPMTLSQIPGDILVLAGWCILGLRVCLRKGAWGSCCAVCGWPGGLPGMGLQPAAQAAYHLP